MRFVIDADCPRRIAAALRESGFEAIDIRDTDPAAADDDIYKLIRKDSLILITRDTDFGNILRYPVSSNCGIIVLRLHLLPVNDIVSTVMDLIGKIPEKDIYGSLIIARQARYRIHKF